MSKGTLSLDKSEFQATIEKFKELKILVIGDLMLDRYTWGTANRLSEEAPVLIVDVERKDERLGGAGNVVNNLLNLGAQVSLAGVVGADFYGEKVLYRLRELGVDANGVFSDHERPTTSKKRVIARGQQVIRIDTEKRQPISEAIENGLIDFISTTLSDYSAVIVSDYAKGVLTPKILNLLGTAAQEKGLSLSNCPIVLDPKPANLKYYQGLNVIKPNAKEAQEISGIQITDQESSLAAAKKISDKLNIATVLMSLNARGSLLYTPEYPDGLFSKTLARKVFDVSGAGDAMVSTFTAAVASGASLEIAANLANLAAAYVVSEVGTIPVDLPGLNSEIDYHCRA